MCWIGLGGMGVGMGAHSGLGWWVVVEIGRVNTMAGGQGAAQIHAQMGASRPSTPGRSLSKPGQQTSSPRLASGWRKASYARSASGVAPCSPAAASKRAAVPWCQQVADSPCKALALRGSDSHANAGLYSFEV